VGINIIPNGGFNRELVNAKGDLIVGTADNTVTSLTAGANGLYLAADSSTASGLVWTTVASGSAGGTAKIADGTESNIFTYNISLPVGAYTVSAYNSNGIRKADSTPGIIATFGSTSYSNVAWITRVASDTETYVASEIVANASTTLTSISINTLPSGGWTTRSYNFGTTAPNDIRGINFGNGNFVIFGVSNAPNSSYIATSTDGVAWTSRNGSFGATGIMDMKYGNAFAGIARNGQVATSTDGVTWTSRFTSPFVNGTGRIFHIPGMTNQWIISGTGSGVNHMYTSTDGVTWTSRTNAGGEDNLKHFAGNSNFATAKYVGVYVTSKNYYQTSTDGVTWTSRPFPTTFNLATDTNVLAANNNRYILVGTNGSNYTSTDGITWTAMSYATSGLISGQTGIYWSTGPGTNQAQWIADLSNTASASTDGVTWHTLSNYLSSKTVHVAYGNGIWHSVPVPSANAGHGYFSTSGFGKIIGDLYVSIQSAGSVTTLT